MLSENERALIALGASVAAVCQPCTAYHVKAARAGGACDRSGSLAIQTALAGRDSATRGIDEWAERCQQGRPEIDAEFQDQKRLIAELASVATAVTVNSVPDLRKHRTAARESGARPEQIQPAIDIARRVKADGGKRDRCHHEQSGGPATSNGRFCGNPLLRFKAC